MTGSSYCPEPPQAVVDAAAVMVVVVGDIVEGAVFREGIGWMA